MIPSDVSGIVNLNFNNLDNNNLAKTVIPIVIDRVTHQSQMIIPDWIRTDASLWSKEKITDSKFIDGINYLIKNKIIIISSTVLSSDSDSIPVWIKNNAGWWADDIIDDKTFLNGVEYLVKQGIISVI
jgi:hypothetical protein